MLIVWLIMIVGAPDLPRLGADDWRTREAETERCSNIFRALLLPPRHDDPEIDFRVKRIRAKQLRFFNPIYVEQMCFRRNFPLWIRHYLAAPGRLHRDLFDVLNDIQQRQSNDPGTVPAILEVLPLSPSDPAAGFLYPMMAASDLPRFAAWLDYHWHPAPMPRAK